MFLTVLKQPGCIHVPDGCLNALLKNKIRLPERVQTLFKLFAEWID